MPYQQVIPEEHQVANNFVIMPTFDVQCPSDEFVHKIGLLVASSAVHS
jgi:hypothetical protein